jgi:hypothetical protein
MTARRSIIVKMDGFFFHLSEEVRRRAEISSRLK